MLCPVAFQKLSKDRNATVSLGNPFHCLISLMGKNPISVYDCCCSDSNSLIISVQVLGDCSLVPPPRWTRLSSTASAGKANAPATDQLGCPLPNLFQFIEIFPLLGDYKLVMVFRCSLKKHWVEGDNYQLQPQAILLFTQAVHCWPFVTAQVYSWLLLSLMLTRAPKPSPQSCSLAESSPACVTDRGSAFPRLNLYHGWISSGSG